MPIRIYALAKELDLDSKELVDICKKAGIPGKGSALASLDDDEEVKVRAFINSSSAPAPAPPASAAPAPERPSGAVKSNRPKVFTSKRKAAIAIPGRKQAEPEEAEVVAEVAEDEAEAPEEIQAVAETEEAVEAVTEEPTSDAPDDADVAEPETDAPARPQRRGVLPVGSRSIKVIGGAKNKPGGKSGEGAAKPKQKRAPAISLAKVPKVKQPTQKKSDNEPAPQKPELKLPQDAIESKRAGKKTPLNLDEFKSRTDREMGLGGGGQDSADSGKKHGKRGKGKPGEGGDLAGMGSHRPDRKKKRRTRLSSNMSDEPEVRRGRRRTLQRTGSNTAAPRKTSATLELPCTVRSFCEASGIPTNRVIMTLMKLGESSPTINAQIDQEFVELLIEEFGIELELRQPESLEDNLLARLDEPDDESTLESRPPVVTFLGHVDHGKTSLLDYLIGTNVVDGEAGGITQHIRAYQIEKDGRKISFVDTPGHAAFTEMRARGANVTDVVVLVIAADDGIMPQTIEAISHAKAAEVPIVVALNKIDLPGADANRVMTQMTEYELTPSEWGGDIEVIPTSAINGDGMDSLLETILTIAELHEYSANPNRPARGTCLEAEQEPGRGVIAKMIVQAGTLKVGDVLVCGSAVGRVKAMYDTLRTKRKLRAAGPSMTLNLTGLDSAPDAGDAFYVLDDIAKAREIADSRSDRTRSAGLSQVKPKVTFDQFQQMLTEGTLGENQEIVELNLIIRADVRGSLEAIQAELGKIQHPEVRIKVMQAAVGGITASDVQLASAFQAVIIGFNVIPDEAARSLSDELGIEIRRYDIIYKVTDDIKAMLEGKLKPEERVVDLGHALVKQVFTVGRVSIAGCYVARGSIQRGCRIRVNRDGRTIGDYPLESLRRIKDDVKEVPRGMECGIKLSGFNDIKKDDVLEAYKIEEVARTL